MNPTDEATPRRFGLRDFKSKRFWELEVLEAGLSVRTGTLGSEGDSEAIQCPSADAAMERAAEILTKAMRVDVQSLEDEIPVWSYESGDRLIHVGHQGSAAMLRASDVTGNRYEPCETRWVRFESSRDAKAAEGRVRKFLDKATDEGGLPELGTIAELLTPPGAVVGPTCPCGECERLFGEGARPPSMSSTSAEMTFTELSTPLIVAGKQLVVGVTPEVLRELCERVDAFAKKRDLKVVLVAQTPPSWPAEGVMGRALVIGRLIAIGNHHGLTKLSVNDLRKGLTEAEALPWAELMPLLSDDRLTSPTESDWECDAEPDDRVELRVFATGALASGMVGFGVPKRDPDYDRDSDVDEDVDVDEDLDEDLDDAEEVWGQDMDQKRQPRLVYGSYVGICDFHDNEGPAVLDVSPRAHKDRTGRLGRLAKKAGYYLLGRYD